MLLVLLVQSLGESEVITNIAAVHEVDMNVYQISWQSIHLLKCQPHDGDQLISRFIKIYRLGTVNICAKFQSNRSNACRDISVSTKVVDQQKTFVSTPGCEWKQRGKMNASCLQGGDGQCVS